MPEVKKAESREITWDEIESADDLKGVRKVSTEEWKANTHTYVKKLSTYDWERWEIYRGSLIVDGKATLGKVGVRAYFAYLVMCDANGKSNVPLQRIQTLAKKSVVVLERIWVEAFKLNGKMGDDSEKKSETVPGDGSVTSLPSMPVTDQA